MALREWLCNIAEIDPQPGGRFYVWWPQGYYASGEFTELEPDETVVFTWMGKGEPAPTQIRVSIAPSDEGTAVTLTHSGLGAGEAWQDAMRQFNRGWDFGLDNLKQTLETGIDQRILRRPFLGVADGALIDEDALEHVPESGGLRLDNLVEGASLYNAGLRVGDILVSLGDVPVSGFQSLGTFLATRLAGDEVEAVFYRNNERMTADVQLSEQPAPEIPATPTELSTTAREVYQQMFAEMTTVMETLDDESASQQPKPGEWSPNQVLAHILLSERDTHNWITSILQGKELNVFTSNHTGRIQAVLEVYPTKARLLNAIQDSFHETYSILANIPDDFVRHKKTYNRMSSNLLLSAQFHMGNHIAQIQKAAALTT
jgi:membrane-associated protease RseP (regulator of RpoE activity)